MQNTEKQAIDIKDAHSQNEEMLDLLYRDVYRKLSKPLLIAMAFQWAKDRIGNDISAQHELLIKASKNYKKHQASKSKSA